MKITQKHTAKQCKKKLTLYKIDIKEHTICIIRLKPKNIVNILLKKRENRDLPFIMDQFTSLAFTMHEIYEFGKFEIKTSHRRQFQISQGLLFKKQ